MANFLDALKMYHNAGIVEDYAVLSLMLYLTDVWGLGITRAACLINTWLGITKIMPLIFLFLMDHYIGTYSLLFVSTTTSALGMGLLSISTPSWLYSRITGSCSEYNMKCISETQQSLFYFALILIMIGRSARAATMESLNFKGNEYEQELMKQLVTFGSDSLVMQASFLLLTPWSIIFAVSSICSSIAMYLLIGKSWSHKLYINKHETSLVTSVLRVIVASFSKISRYESASFNQEIQIHDSLLRRISNLRFIQKTAPQPTSDKREKNGWTLCSTQEVEDAKTFVRMLPVGIMFAFLVLISSIGSTYFLQQAKRMKPVAIFGFEIVNVRYLAWLYFSTKVRFHDDREQMLKYNNTYEHKQMMRSGLTYAMTHAILCCVIAALVENSRLGVITRHGLANKPGEIIPMTMFWLLPQFYILGCFDASLERIIQIFFAEVMPLPMKKFMIFVFEGFLGLGVMSSVLVVYLVGKISETRGRPNWFQHDTENSRLDLFYWTLTLLCVVVFSLWFQAPHYLSWSRRYSNSWQQPDVS